ncbi:ABC transporter substrate-binding protein [Sedimentibacter saalensis]|uniref:Iron complex transport system substrate-binding protein n=1 Tax=Sedimentibacter saalensis TaxID=130788 RepID=A0A562JCN3_9FIRM|nr:ABC transporter substrate-binding protein [Sedimentibacter saalensis]MEA5093846.1 ABC transporter substrate-binding protein [Sedimentibacter saalensis]TWH80654.1 iron complex transport system substrate-binding protein [Sedimentibacter saalensis]
MLKKNIQIPLLILILLTAMVAVSCSNSQASSDETKVSAENMNYTFEDSLGNEVVLKEKPRNVIALSGSYAETWLLAGGNIAGTTDDSISERNIKLSETTKIVGTIKEPNLEEILSLSPDFIILSSDIESHLELKETLTKANIPHAYFKVEQFEDYLKMLDICTDITGNKDLYEKNGLEVQNEIETVKSDIISSTSNPSVLFIRAFSGGAKAKDDDNFACRILDDLGTTNIASKHQSILEELSMEEIIEEDPDYIFVTTMGNTEKAIEAMKSGIEKNPAWSNLSAVKNGRYIVLPKELFHYKPNAKWGESYEYLAKIIYPEIFK